MTSTKKPEDHKPKLKDPIVVEFHGERFEVDGRAPKDTRALFALRSNDTETALTRLIGAEGVERAIAAIEDQDGFADIEDLLELVGAIYEKAGSKNS